MDNTKFATSFNKANTRFLGGNFKAGVRFSRRIRKLGYIYKDYQERGKTYQQTFNPCARDHTLDDVHYTLQLPNVWHVDPEEVTLESAAAIPVDDGQDADNREDKMINSRNLYQDYQSFNHVTCLQNILKINDPDERLQKVERAMYAKTVMAHANFVKEMVEAKMMKTLAMEKALRNIDTETRNNWSKQNMLKPLYKAK